MKVTIGICVVSGIIAAVAPANVQAQEPRPVPPAADLHQAAEQLRGIAQLAELEALKNLKGLKRLAIALDDGQVREQLQALQQQLQQQGQRLREPRQAQPPAVPRPPRPPRPARDNDRGAEVTENYTRTVRLGRNGTFDLANVAGDVVITGGGGDEVRIEAVKRIRGRDDSDARAALSELQIQVNERSGLVEVRTEFPRRRNLSAGVDFTITLPAGANVSLKTVSGDLRVSGVKGELRAESISGDVRLSAVEALRAAKSVSGDIEVSDAEGEDVSASTVSGDIILRKLRTRGIDLQSVSGNLRFSDAESERVNLRSISGDIEYEGRLARSGRYDMQSHSGNIRIAPAGNPGFDIEASTFSGEVRSDYALTLRGGAPANALTARDRPRLNRTIRGAFGDASAILSLRSFSGNIVVVKR